MSMCNEETARLVMPTGEDEARQNCDALTIRAPERAGENARLRNALQLIADWQGGCGVDWPQEMARKALDANPKVLVPRAPRGNEQPVVGGPK